ncbi:MAG: hypothetical protein MJE66_14035 [Proteobacteria bacterium]|nr:hypothetical protein [Pseudomonadota bacterium]
MESWIRDAAEGFDASDATTSLVELVCQLSEFTEDVTEIGDLIACVVGDT